MSWNDFLPELAAKHEVLETLYADIGTPEGEKTRECQSLFDKFLGVINDHIQQAEHQKTRFGQECEQMLDDIRRMTGLLGQGEDGVEKLVETLHGMSLWDRHSLMREEYSYIFEHYKQKLDETRALHQKLSEYATILGPSYVQPGPYPEEGVAVTFDVVRQFSDNIAACEKEQKRRIEAVESAIIAIRHLWNELGMTPQDAFDRDVIDAEHEQVPVSDEVIRRLEMRRTMLEDERSQRETLVKEHLTEITQLWDKLRIEDDEREEFSASHVGLTMDTIREYKAELSRLEELKSQKLEEFITDERDSLFELWDRLYYSREQRESFEPVFDNEFTDENLALHEAEVVRLKDEVEETEHILSAIEKYRRMLDEIREFEVTSMDAQRLFHRDPGRLLREEKFRKRIAREFPRIEADLEEALYAWQQVKGRPFLVYGEEYINTMKLHAQEAREGKENEKLWREQRKHLSLQRDLRYGSQNPKKVAPQSPHPRRITPPMDTANRRSPPPSISSPLPKTPTSKRIGLNVTSRPGTPSANHTRSIPQFIPTTPTRARSHTVHAASPQPHRHGSTLQSPHGLQSIQLHRHNGYGSKPYSRSESPATTSFSLTRLPSTPTKQSGGVRNSAVMSASGLMDTRGDSVYNRSNSIISVASSTTTEVMAGPGSSTPSRSMRMVRPISLDLTGLDEEELVPQSTPRNLKRTAADLSSPSFSPPGSPSFVHQHHRRRSRSASPVSKSCPSLPLRGDPTVSPFMDDGNSVSDHEQRPRGKKGPPGGLLLKQLLEARSEQEHDDEDDAGMERDRDSIIELDQKEVEQVFSSSNKVIHVLDSGDQDQETKSEGWETENDESPRSRRESQLQESNAPRSRDNKGHVMGVI
ncbi:hypothetical protein KVV02_001398 [Mortierella alpina]|uniref:Microtubule associated protein n=1 Tax=Mortierella alpina TaxID=64518 RepID=A0A9P8D154_MORAP|nr:hypothetical protein KVV02_001398 [Mortierella alpina]